MAIVRESAQAEDIVQETFIRAWERRKEFGKLLSLRLFLWRTARNLTLDWLRHEQIIRKHSGAVSAEIGEDFLDQKMIEEEMIGEIRRAILRM